MILMKKLTKLLALALVLSVALLALASCDKSKSIKEAFEAEGYTVSVISAKNEKAKAIFTLLNYTEDEIDAHPRCFWLPHFAQFVIVLPHFFF